MGNRNVLIEACAHEYVVYFGLHGQIGRYPVGECPAEPLAGTVYERGYTLLKDAVTEDGEPLEQLDCFPLKAGPRRFLRGRLVTDKKEATMLLMPPFLQELVFIADLELVGIPTALTVVAVQQADGTEVGIPLQDGDVPPPEGASPYAVGESPEEVDAAELEQMRQDAKDGVYDEEEAAVGGGPDEDPVDADCFGDGGGHPTIPPFPDRDDGPRTA